MTRMADEALLRRLERSEALSAAAFDGIGISQDGRIVEANDQLAKLLGCDHGDLIGEDVHTFVAPESYERVATARRSRDTEPYDHVARRKDGSSFIVEVRGRPIVYQGREARVTALRDVSEQRRLAEAVRSIVQATVVVGESFFAALARGVTDALEMDYALVGELFDAHAASPDPRNHRHVRSVAFWGHGQPLDAIEYSSAGTPAERLLHDSACLYTDDARGQFPGDPVLERFSADALFAISLVGADGQAIGVLVTWRAGKVEHVELARSILALFAGRAAAELGRVQADRALRRSEESLRAIIDATPHVAIQWYDADGRTLLWNKASEHIFGWSAEQALGKTLDKLILDTNESTVFRARFDQTLRTRQPFGPAEYSFRRPDGTEGRCLSTLFHVPDSDGGARAACIDVDITAWHRAEESRVELERQLQHAQQLEALGVLSANIAHDFNNILTAIFAYNELARVDIETPEIVRKHLTALQMAALRARDLVRQILNFSRRHTPAQRSVHLQQVVRETLEFVRSALPSTIRIESVIDDNALAVRASPIQMHQVIVNLCTNAAQSMSGGVGLIRVQLDAVHIEAQGDPSAPELAPGRYVRLEVADTGRGMDEDTVQHIFEPFFTTNGQEGGTGLGLAIIRGIIKDHGGTIRVTSAPGRGTSFRLYLPALGAESPAGEEAPSAMPTGHGERVLVVDDEATLCYAYASVLERLGYRVTRHTDPRRALEAFVMNPHEFDVVVTDLTMPHMKGTDLAEHLLMIRPALPILLLSGLADAVGPDELAALGLRGFLAKPFLPAALADAVHRALHPIA
jgi:PAS domain S-box-containing protein